MSEPATNPGGRPRKLVDLAAVRALIQQGVSLRKIARQLRLGCGTVYRVLPLLNGTAQVIQNPSAMSLKNNRDHANVNNESV